jgi:AraC-like DNA-binding protein
MAIGFNIVRTLCGPQWTATDVQFSFAEPPDTTAIRRFFNVTPRFDQDRSSITFASHWLAHAPSGADPLLHLMMHARVKELMATASQSTTTGAQVRRLLRASVASAGCTLQSAAAQLLMSSRTLKRRLADEKVTFLQLRDEARYNAACQMLRHTRLPANEIASILGYSNGSAFTRAFHRWSGLNPTVWRSKPPRTSSRRTATALPRRQKHR